MGNETGVGNGGNPEQRLNRLERIVEAHLAREDERTKAFEACFRRNEQDHSHLMRELDEVAKGHIELREAVIRNRVYLGAFLGVIVIVTDVLTRYFIGG